MSFDRPVELLLAALAVGAFFLLYRALEARKRTGTLLYSNLKFVVAATQERPILGRILAAAWVTAVALLAIALAGPHMRVWVPAKDGAVVLCIDTSGSMAATDISPNRADAAKAASLAFITHIPAGTHVALVAFSSEAAVVAPLTTDTVRLRAAMDQVPLPNGATAIGDALLLAGSTLPPSGHRVVILITDGVNNRGQDPLAAAQVLGAKGIRLFTVGIGTNGGSIIPGTNQEASIDEDALRAYASAGGGTYSRAGDANALRQTLAALGRTTTLEVKKVDVALPAAMAGSLLMIVAFLSGMAAGRYP